MTSWNNLYEISLDSYKKKYLVEPHMPFRSYANSYNFAEKIISKFQRFYEMYACQNGKKVIKFGFWVQKKRLAKTNRPLTFATLDPAL